MGPLFTCVSSKALYDSKEVTLVAFLDTWQSNLGVGSITLLGMFSWMLFKRPWDTQTKHKHVRQMAPRSYYPQQTVAQESMLDAILLVCPWLKISVLNPYPHHFEYDYVSTSSHFKWIHLQQIRVFGKINTWKDRRKHSNQHTFKRQHISVCGGPMCVRD